MKVLFFILLTFPFVAESQYESNPAQQTVWEILEDAAPVYEMLLACDRDVTAELLWEDTAGYVAHYTVTNDDIRIVLEIWNKARRQTHIADYDMLNWLSAGVDQEAIDTCNSVENRTIQMLGAGA